MYCIIGFEIEFFRSLGRFKRIYFFTDGQLFQTIFKAIHPNLKPPAIGLKGFYSGAKKDKKCPKTLSSILFVFFRF